MDDFFHGQLRFGLERDVGPRRGVSAGPCRDPAGRPPMAIDPPDAAPNGPRPSGGAGGSRGETIPPHPDPLLGTTVDGVRLVRRLGEGGFAVVYEGRQIAPDATPPVVAVKILHPRLASPGFVRRFEYEAGILARLDHPGIARILRLAHTTLQGVEVPCIVMEVVPAAKPITKYAGDLSLPVRDRIELLRQAAEAIGYAHRQGVLHRDVKPGNILVGSDGRAKVIDYGWGRGLDSAAVLQSAGTVFGQFVGTWQYMSPEQFEPDPAAVDMRADVYALGAVLQELLTGRPPHRYRGGPVFHFATTVREEPPAPLPHDDAEIDRQLRGIVARCLAKDRNRRYPTAGDLADDLGRHLDGEPVAPDSASLGDGLRYLARKHAAAAAAAAVSLAALVAATVGITLFSIRTERARSDAASLAERLGRESIRAGAEAARATAAAEDAKRQLYVANLHRLAIPDTAPASSTLRLYLDTAKLVADGDQAVHSRALPLELLCLRPRVTQPIDRFIDEPVSNVAALAVSAGGDRFATAGLDGGVTLRERDGSVVARMAGGTPMHRLLFTPRWLVAAARDGRITLADALTGAPGPELPLGVDVTSVAADAAGRVLAAGCHDGSLRLVRMGDDGPAGDPLPVAAHRRKVQSVVVSPDGRLVVSLSADGTARVTDAAGGAALATLAGVPERGARVAFSPCGRRFACSGRDQAIRIIDAATLESTMIPRTPAGPLAALAFSPDGAVLAVADDDGAVSLYDPARAARIGLLAGHRGRVTTLAFAPGGGTLASAAADRTIRLWRVADGALLRTLEGHEDAVGRLAWAPDGRSLLSGGADGLTLRWDTTSPDGSRVLGGELAPYEGVLFLPGSTRFVAWSADGSAGVWDAATAREVLRLGEPRGGLSAAAVSPDGRTVALGGTDDRIVLHDTGDGAVKGVLRGHTRRITHLEFAAGGDRLASASDDGTARIWTVADAACLHELAGHAGPVLVVAFSPDGRRVATASRDGTARLWNPGEGGAAITLSGHDGAVRALAFSPDGQLLATGSADATARLWRSADGTPAGTLRAGTSDVTRVLFTGRGTRLVTGTMRGGLDLWDVATGERRTSLDGHAAEIRAIVATPDGTRLATASSDRTIRIWDADHGTELLLLRGHDGAVTDVAVSDDGRELVSASADRTLRLWARSDDEIQERRRLVGLPATSRATVFDPPAQAAP